MARVIAGGGGLPSLPFLLQTETRVGLAAAASDSDGAVRPRSAAHNAWAAGAPAQSGRCSPNRSGPIWWD